MTLIPACQQVSQPTSQPTNQPTNQPSNQSANQPTNQSASQPASCRSTHVYIGNPENKTDSAKERCPGWIMRNKINVTQSRLSFEISLPVFAADKCSIYTTNYLYTEVARFSNSPSTASTLGKKRCLEKNIRHDHDVRFEPRSYKNEITLTLTRFREKIINI